jgi:GH18 family chitinase
LFSADRQEFISYENPKSLAYKCKFILKNQLAGVMCWDLGGDTRDQWAPNGEFIAGWELLETAVQYLRGEIWSSRLPQTSHVSRRALTFGLLPSVVCDIQQPDKPMAPTDPLPLFAPDDFDPLKLTKLMVGYYNNWSVYQRDFLPDQLPLNRLTHLIYAHAELSSDGTVASSDQWAGMS